MGIHHPRTLLNFRIPGLNLPLNGIPRAEAVEFAHPAAMADTHKSRRAVLLFHRYTTRSFSVSCEDAPPSLITWADDAFLRPHFRSRCIVTAAGTYPHFGFGVRGMLEGCPANCLVVRFRVRPIEATTDLGSLAISLRPDTQCLMCSWLVGYPAVRWD